MVTQNSLLFLDVFMFLTLILYWQDVKFSHHYDIKFSNTNTVLTSDIAFTCSLQSREVISGVSEACMQWVLKQNYLCSLDTWQQPTHVFCPFTLSFHPLQGGFQSKAREPSGGTLRRLQGVQKKKELSDSHFIFIWGCADRLLNVMFYGCGHSLIKRGGQWSTQVSQKKVTETLFHKKKKLTCPCWPPIHVGC